jgi:hypothetical protein
VVTFSKEVIEALLKLDEHCSKLVRDNPDLETLLVPIEPEVIEKMRKPAWYYRDWRL